jgi:uncharacterized membrane protein YeaQ/YmgE (transglycosylase-associated protein family)
LVLEQSTTGSIVNLIIGFSGAVIISLIAKRFGKNQEIAKVSYVIASLFVVLFSIAVIRQDSFAIICIGLAGFGFFGFAAYPMAMELAVEASYPIDASISESWVHINVQVKVSFTNLHQSAKSSLLQITLFCALGLMNNFNSIFLLWV